MLNAKHTAGLLVAVALASAVAAQAAPKYPYKVTVLIPFTPGQGSGVANMINNRGLICGFLSSNAGYCYSHGKVTQLVPLPGDTWAIPSGLNDRGQVVGYSYSQDGPRHAVVFVDGAAQPLPVSSHLYSVANDINNFGQIVGGLSDVQDESLAYLLTRGTVRLLGTLGGPRRIDFANSINDHGQIVGAVSQPNTPPEPGHQVAFLYENGAMRALPTPAGHTSVANKINSHGQIVGFTQVYNGGINGTRAVLWDKHRMKTLLDRVADARDINIRGQVVGGYLTVFGGYLYEPGKGARDLNDLIDPASGFTVAPQAINDRQEIVGFGCKENLCGPVLLEPVHHARSAEDNPSGNHFSD
ncbi:MAG: hypothetical protein ACXWC4_15120 [Telluria sp.]